MMNHHMSGPVRLRTDHRLPLWKRVAIAVFSTVLLGAGGVLVAPAASAATVVAGVSLRPCVNLANPNCAPVGTTGSTGVNAQRCYRDGSWATGRYSSNRWFLLYLSDGREGYVHSSYVTNQTPGTQECTTLPYVRVADWAIARLGEVWAGPHTGWWTNGDWSPGPAGEWSGDCAKLASGAHRAAGVAFAGGNAWDQYVTYRNAGKVYGGLPRYGAAVFYETAMPYGHVAIYIGGTTIVSTQGMDNAYLPIARRDIYSFPSYRGWAKVG